MLPNGRYSKTYVDSTIEGMVDEGTIKSATIFFRKDGRIDRKLTSSKMLELMENKIKIKFLDKDIARAEDLSSTAWTQRRRDRFFGEYNSKSAVRDDLRQTVEGQKQRRKNN
jgi:hypothetical protein